MMRNVRVYAPLGALLFVLLGAWMGISADAQDRGRRPGRSRLAENPRKAVNVPGRKRLVFKRGRSVFSCEARVVVKRPRGKPPQVAVAGLVNSIAGPRGKIRIKGLRMFANGKLLKAAAGRTASSAEPQEQTIPVQMEPAEGSSTDVSAEVECEVQSSGEDKPSNYKVQSQPLRLQGCKPPARAAQPSPDKPGKDNDQP